MGGFEQVAWFPLCAGLTALGLVASWVLWRRRGSASGLRMVGWSLLPLAAYLTGVITVLWDIGTTIARWAIGVVISPLVWAGIALVGVSVVAFVVSGAMRGRARGETGRTARGEKGTGSAVAGSGPSPREVGAGGARTGRVGSGSGASGSATDASGEDDLSDVEEILRRRGIT